jgi:capsular exopolysaccharide synthesis family protein
VSNVRPELKTAIIHTTDIGIADIWSFLVRRRFLLAGGVVLGTLLAGVAYVRAPRLYTATVTVEMTRSSNGLPELSGATTFDEESGLMLDMLTQQAVLMNDSTALSVIKHLDLMSVPPYNSLVPAGSSNSQRNSILDENSQVLAQAVGMFKGGLRTTPVKNTRLLAVSYTDRDPRRAALIANAVVDAYLENHTKAQYDATVKISSWLTDQLDALKRNTEDIHVQVASLEKKSGVFTTPVAASTLNNTSSDPVNSSPEYHRLYAMNEELSRLEILRIEKEAVYRLTQSNDPQVILGMSGSEIVREAGGVLAPNSQIMQLLQTLRVQEAALETRLASDTVKYGPRNPIIVETQKQLDSVHSQIAQTLNEMNNATKADYLVAKGNEDALRRTVEETQTHLASLGDDLASLTFLREEEASSRALYQDLYRRLEEADIAAGVKSAGMTVDDPARVPTGTSSPVLKNYMIVGLGAGMLVGVLTGLLLQARDTLLYTPEEFEKSSPFPAKSSPYPLLGIVPGFDTFGHSPYQTKEIAPNAENEPAWILRSPKSHLAEAYRQIRTSVLLSNIDSPPRVILVTSADTGDGKTTTAYNLAAAFAAQSSNTLLMAADMRRPSKMMIPAGGTTDGLSEVFSNRAALANVIQTHPLLPTLKILTAGTTLPPDPAELLGSKRFTELMKELRQNFEYILIDAPPVVPVTDPVVLAVASDAVIAVVRAGKTRKQDMREMWTGLDKPSINILGFIVNDYHGSQKRYYYYKEDEPEKSSRWPRRGQK